MAFFAAQASPAPRLAFQNEPPVVLLPLAAGGIRDQRQSFAASFQRELNNSHDGSAQRFAGAYLHLEDAARAVEPERERAASFAGVSILLIPGIFSDCVDDQSLPFGDGVARPRPLSYTRGYQQYADLGVAGMRAVPIRGRASSAQNGTLIAREILFEAGRRDVSSIILVAYSKGVPDTLHALTALERSNKLPRKLATMVSVAGVVMGTPLADAHAGLHKALAALPGLFSCPTSEGGEIDSLRPQTRIAWLADHPPPRALTYYSLVAYATRDKIAPGLVRFFDELAVMGYRSDGQVIPAHAILPHSALLAEVNSDHWTFVLPLASHPSWLIRAAASRQAFPREALFRAILRYVVAAADESSGPAEALPSSALPSDNGGQNADYRPK